MADMKKKKLRKAFAPPFEPYTEDRKRLRDAMKENADNEVVEMPARPETKPAKTTAVFDAPSDNVLTAQELREYKQDEMDSDADLEFSAKKKPARKRRPLDLVRRLRDKFSE